MSMTQGQKEAVTETIRDRLEYKLSNYNPEPAYMPFHTRLLGKDRLALYSFIHSLSTNFGTSIYEPVAVKLAKASGGFRDARSQAKPAGKISKESQDEIQVIMNGLSSAQRRPDKKDEIKSIRKTCQKGELRDVKPTKIDLFLEDETGKIYLIDLKTAKPNKGGFKEFKRTLLEWAAVSLCENPKADVSTLIAIPYNPYEPEPYARWTMAGMLDLDEELKVGKEFWDFVGGDGAYEDLLDCFERVGIEMRDRIDNYFKEIADRPN